MEYLEILKWPLLILIVIFIFHKQIKELIINIADFSISKDGLSARIGRPKPPPSSETRAFPTTIDENNKYLSAAKEGKVTFDYSNNNGVYTIGENDYRFDTQWSKASKEYIHFYKDQPSIKSVRLAKDVSNLDEVRPENYDSSSRARTVGINQIAIFENNNGKFLAMKILALKDDSRGDDSDEIIFEYKVLD